LKSVYNKSEAEVFLTANALKLNENKSCKDIFDAPNKGPHYTFIIGNDQILQNKLESAVSEITRFQFFIEKQLV
jgi:cell division protease FtsH